MRNNNFDQVELKKFLIKFQLKTETYQSIYRNFTLFLLFLLNYKILQGVRALKKHIGKIAKKKLNSQKIIGRISNNNS